MAGDLDAHGAHDAGETNEWSDVHETDNPDVVVPMAYAIRATQNITSGQFRRGRQHERLGRQSANQRCPPLTRRPGEFAARTRQLDLHVLPQPAFDWSGED